MKRRFLEYFYIGTAIVSLSLLTTFTYNYLQFFPAIESISATLEHQEVTIDSQAAQALISSKLRVSNPSGYSGFRVQWINARLFFKTQNASLFEQFNLFYGTSPDLPFGPGQTMVVNATFHLVGQQAADFINFYNEHKAEGFASYNISIRVNTFLEAMIILDVVREFEQPLQ